MEKTNRKNETEERNLSREEVKKILADLNRYISRAAYPVKHPAFSRIWHLLTIMRRKEQLANLKRLRKLLLKKNDAPQLNPIVPFKLRDASTTLSMTRSQQRAARNK